MAQKYNSTVVFPKDSSYIIRCVECTFAPSNAGNPMLTFKYEIVSPDMVEVAGEEFIIAGTQLMNWQVCQTMDGDTIDVVKSTKNADDLKKLVSAFGGDPTTVDPQNPDTSLFKGKVVYALLYNDEQDQRKSPTAAQLKAGQKQGDVLIHPITKQPLKRNYPKIGEIFGLAPLDSNKPY